MDNLIIFGAKYLFLAVVLLLAAGWQQAPKKSRLELSVTTAAALILAAILDKVLSKLYYDPRPFVTQHIQPLVPHAADNGFPSEHTLLSFTLAAALFIYRPKLGAAAAVLALAVGAARVAAHVHSPIDIIGAIAIGALSAYCGLKLTPRVLSRKKV